MLQSNSQPVRRQLSKLQECCEATFHVKRRYETLRVFCQIHAFTSFGSRLKERLNYGVVGRGSCYKKYTESSCFNLSDRWGRGLSRGNLRGARGTVGRSNVNCSPSPTSAKRYLPYSGAHDDAFVEHLERR